MNRDLLHAVVHAAHHVVAGIEARIDVLAVPLQEAHLRAMQAAAREGRRPSVDAGTFATAATVGLGPFVGERVTAWMSGVLRPATLDELRGVLLGPPRVATLHSDASPLSWRQRASAALRAVHAVLDHATVLAHTPEDVATAFAIIDELGDRASAPCARLEASAFRAWCLAPLVPAPPRAQCA